MMQQILVAKIIPKMQHVFPFLGGDGQQILELASQECTNQSLHCSTNQPMGNQHLQIDR
jgi:hypothetical protein